MAQAAVLRAQNRATNKGSDPRVATCRGKLQNRRSKLNQEINRELRLRAGAENLFRATTNRKMKETVALELSFVNSNLQLLKEQLAELNGSVEVYQGESVEPVMPMVPLGLKETKEIDFREPFKDFILEHYSEDGGKYESAITEFMELRQGMRTPQRDSTGISLLFQYYNQLYFVERRFFPPDRSLGIYFEWFDSLTGVPSSQRTVAFEKASVLFNLGALYTQIATKSDRGRAKALDQAVDSFLRAAGAFSYLEDNFANAPTMDLSPGTLRVLVHLMLAQARECLFEKLELQSMDKMNSDMYYDMAQEASKIVDSYLEAENLMSPVSDYLPPSWTSLASVKKEHYSALASHRTGLGLLFANPHSHPGCSRGGRRGRGKEGDSGGNGKNGEKEPNNPTPKPRGISMRSGKLLAWLNDSPASLLVEGITLKEKLRILASAHLKSALNHHEEAARLQRMCRELRGKRGLSQVIAKSARESQDAYSKLNQDSQQLAELIVDPPPLPGKSHLPLALTLPDFGQERVEDFFKPLGPLAVFSAKSHWSAPRTVRLQHPLNNRHQASNDESQIRIPPRCKRTGCVEERKGDAIGGDEACTTSAYGFTISTDCPVVVTSIGNNSLAQFGGIKEGDFLVGIGEADIKWSTHEEVVRLIRDVKSSTLNLKVVTPMSRNNYHLKASSKRSSSKSLKKSVGSPGDSPTTPQSSILKPPPSPQSGLSVATLQKKLSWNPFKRSSRERETASMGIASR